MKILMQIFYLSFVVSICKAQTIFTLAGNGTGGYSGDGGSANLAMINAPDGIATDGSGNVYFSDGGNHRIRKVSTSGIITTIAGTGIAGFSGDGGLATFAQINSPKALTVDVFGNIYFADNSNFRIRKISTSGIITTVAGNGVGAYSGDGGNAVLAGLYNPVSVAVDFSGNIFIGESSPTKMTLRKVDNLNLINTISGGNVGYAGDGGPALLAQFNGVNGLATDAGGNIYITDTGNNRVRLITTTSTITTIIGNGLSGFSGDGGPGTSAKLNLPYGVDVDGAGNLFFGDLANYRIRMIDIFGTISTIAGTGISGFSGDGGPSTLAKISVVRDVAVDLSGNIYFSDQINNRIRVICQASCITGINHITQNNLQIFYPNPVNDKLFISSENDIKDVLVRNSLGQLILKQDVNSKQTQIDVNQLSEGVYLISFQFKDGNSVTKKIIKN